MADDEKAGGSPSGSYAGGCESAHCNVLSWEQVQRLDRILSETIPIHGRGNFPTLAMQPRQIVKVVRSRLEEKGIGLRDVRLNGSAASHVLHQDSGLGYKDLDLIFCADLCRALQISQLGSAAAWFARHASRCGSGGNLGGFNVCEKETASARHAFSCVHNAPEEMHIPFSRRWHELVRLNAFKIF